MNDQAAPPPTPLPGPDVQLPGEWVPNNRSPNDIIGESRIILNFEETDLFRPRKLQFSMTTRTGYDSYISTDAKYGRHFVIPSDVVLRFELSGDWEWEFDEVPISFKRQVDARHYAVDFDPANPRHMALRARHNQGGGGPLGEVHSCSFNVKLTQGERTKLKVKIDPEIKNPPPNQYNTVPAGEKALF
jgi:hypothetical protein